MGNDVNLGPVLREIRTLGQQVVQVDQQVVQVTEKVVAVGRDQQRALGELAQLRQDFLDFVGHAQRTANLQRAETRIGVLQDEMDHEFGHHKVVRRTAVGILQAFDVGLVTNEIVNTVSQELMVQTPRYWLAPSLVALAAWTCSDRDLCDRAVQEAFRRSPERTALFFSLVLRRQDRHESALRWLRHYLNALDPAALGREFAVVLEAISQGAFGPAGVELVQQTLTQWRQLLANDEAVLAAQVRRWRAEVDSFSGPSSSADFPRLAAISPQWAALDQGLGRAQAHRGLLDKYRALMAEEITPADRIEDAVDDILDRLVGEYDTEELPRRRELALQKAIVTHEGDVDAARANTEADAATLETQIDYLTLQSAAALNPAGIGVSTATQRVAIAACNEWFTAAHDDFCAQYRSRLPGDVQARFTDQHNLGATVFQLPEWIGSFTTPLPQLEAALSAHWDRHTEPFLARMVYNWQRAIILPAVVCVLALLVLVPFSIVVGLVVAVLVGGIWGLVIFNRFSTAEQHRAQVRKLLEQAKRDSLAQLRGAGAEVTDWSARFKAADSVAPQLRSLITSLATAGHGLTPFERRVVDTAGGWG